MLSNLGNKVIPGIFGLSYLFEYCTPDAKLRNECSLKRSTDLHKDFGGFSIIRYF